MAIADELAELTLALCRIPSETGEEREIADWVEARCRATLEDGVHRVGNSVVCVAPAAGEDRPTVALVGHLDTVRCAEDQPYEIRDGRVYGCGATDMKAGDAVMLALLERWRSLEAVRPVWIFYDGEEGPEEVNGLEPVLRSGVLPPLDLALVLEPTDRSLMMGCMGTLHATVTVHGKRAHSARPWQGENALYRSIPLLQRFSDLQRREVRFGDLTYYEVMGITQARTENSKNVVPDHVWFNVNVRFAPGRTPEEAEAELRSLVGNLGDVEITDRAPAGDVYLDHPLVEPWRVREGIPIEPKQAWTDVARFTARGIPAVNFGPGETAQAHQSGEWCSIGSLEYVWEKLWAYFRRPTP
ncbi:MAG TPA: succinyl-diaminopimelate desuccinylase [Longimicrobiaceae bacterium]|nr:succinyl-diaminopimelate desuccinylase [Longimicrobiaceae bacterium]